MSAEFENVRYVPGGDVVVSLPGQEWVIRADDGRQAVNDECKHCGRPIVSDDDVYWSHRTRGGYAGKRRCDPAQSGLPYGCDAEPVGREFKVIAEGTTE